MAAGRRQAIDDPHKPANGQLGFLFGYHQLKRSSCLVERWIRPKATGAPKVRDSKAQGEALGERPPNGTSALKGRDSSALGSICDRAFDAAAGFTPLG